MVHNHRCWSRKAYSLLMSYDVPSLTHCYNISAPTPFPLRFPRDFAWLNFQRVLLNERRIGQRFFVFIVIGSVTLLRLALDSLRTVTVSFIVVFVVNVAVMRTAATAAFAGHLVRVNVHEHAFFRRWRHFHSLNGTEKGKHGQSIVEERITVTKTVRILVTNSS